MSEINIKGSDGFETSFDSQGNIIISPKWISVKDRMPEPETNVLTWGSYDEPWVHLECFRSHYCHGEYDRELVFSRNGLRVTHWMPLPLPPLL